MEFKKSELTYFAKQCAKGAGYMVLGLCYADEIAHSDLGRKIYNEELLFQISKRYAKYCKDEIAFDVENSEMQDFQSIISHVVNCCEEHNWFREE